MTPQHPAAPETETDANGLTEAERSDLFLSMPDDISGVEERRLYAAVERIVAERVRVVEGERGNPPYAAIVADRDECLRLGQKYRARAESAEAAHEAEKAAHERLRDAADEVRELAETQAESCRNQHRADHARNWQAVLDLLGGGEAR